MIWPSNLDFDDFFQKVNSLVPSIKFTTEWEREDKIPFLDTMVHRQISGFVFGIYRKPTHSNQYIHYFSWQSEKIKKSSIFSLLYRAYRICDYIHLDREIQFLYNAFQRVGFPIHVLEDVHSKVRRKITASHSPVEEEEPDRPAWISLPYGRHVEQFVAPVMRSHNVRVVNKSSGSIKRRLVHNRPPRDSNRVDVAGVYTVPCKDCDKSYYGETGRKFSDRLREHKRCVEKKDKNSACYKHVNETNPSHILDWDHARLLWPSENLNDRLVVESSLICSKPNFNAKNSTLSVDKSSAEIIVKTVPFSIDPP